MKLMPCLASAFTGFPFTFERVRRILRSFLSVLLLSASGLFIWNTGALAATDKECLATWKEPNIKVEVVNAKPELNHRKSSGQIERVAKKSGYAKSTRHASLLGLTSSSVGPSLGATTKYKVINPDKTCLRLDRVKLTFGARKTDVYIDRKYRKGSCPYKTILAHEMEHVRINNRVIAEYVPRIKRELAERAGGIKPFFTKNLKRAGQSIVNRLMLELDPLIEEFNDARMMANDVIDTQESYAATHAKCKDW